jgi:ABC-type transport system involved in multi-copper enzyme maturation permease subunit
VPLVANPIIQRELIGTLRSYRTVIALGLLSLVFTLLVAVRYPTEPRMALSGARSQEVFKLFMFGLLGALLLLLPVFPATSLVKERNRGTLGLLLNTLLGPWRIFLGKLTASFSLAVLMLFVSLPAATACFALGGVDPTTGLGGCYLVLLLTALELCAIALFMSSTATSSDAAIRTTYGIVLSLSLITLLPYTLFVGNGGPIETVADWLRCLSPVSAIMSLLGGADATSHGLSSSSNVPLRFAILSLAVTAICSVWTTSRLNFTLFDRARSPGTIVDDQSSNVRFLRRLMFIVDPGRRSRAMSSFVNPVMVKEFRCRKFGRLHWLMRLVSVCAIISVGLAFVTATRTVAWDVGMIGGIMVILQVALIVLLTPSLTAGLICTERESGGWVLLQMSPMSIPSILWGSCCRSS